MIDHAQLERYITASRLRFEDLLGQMVHIPSISMDPARAPDIRRMAEFARQLLADLGADVRIVETGGYPIVSGGWVTGVQYPTVTIYNPNVGSQVCEELPRKFRHAPDVGGSGRVHADRGNLHHLAQQVFKPEAAVCDVAFKLCVIDHG